MGKDSDKEGFNKGKGRKKLKSKKGKEKIVEEEEEKNDDNSDLTEEFSTDSIVEELQSSSSLLGQIPPPWGSVQTISYSFDKIICYHADSRTEAMLDLAMKKLIFILREIKTGGYKSIITKKKGNISKRGLKIYKLKYDASSFNISKFKLKAGENVSDIVTDVIMESSLQINAINQKEIFKIVGISYSQYGRKITFHILDSLPMCYERLKELKENGGRSDEYR